MEEKISTGTLGHKKGASSSHRTATTFYPCCLPTLGKFKGAGRMRLTPAQNYTFITIRKDAIHFLYRKYTNIRNPK